MGEGEQAELAAQLGAVAERALQEVGRDMDEVDDHRLAVAVRRLRVVVVPAEEDAGDRRGRRDRGGDEPDQLAGAVALGAPGLAGAGHDAEAAPERRQLVEELLTDLERREGGRVGRGVADLDAWMAPGAPEAHRDRGVAVEDRVGDDLGQGQLGVLAQLRAADLGSTTPATQRRACSAPRGPGASDSAGRFSGTVTPHVQAR